MTRQGDRGRNKETMDENKNMTEGSEPEELEEASEELKAVMEDEAVPQNIRDSIKEAREHLLNEEKDVSERAASSINILNDVSNDPNLPMHTRTKIWNISGKLETVTME